MGDTFCRRGPSIEYFRAFTSAIRERFFPSISSSFRARPRRRRHSSLRLSSLRGHRPTALCTSGLHELGVTHVLNAAQGRRTDDGYDGFVNTNAFYYGRAGIAFFGVPAPDFVSFRLSPYFRDAADFIDRALEEQGQVNDVTRVLFIASAKLSSKSTSFPFRLHSQWIKV